MQPVMHTAGAVAVPHVLHPLTLPTSHLFVAGSQEHFLVECDVIDCEDGTYLGVYSPPAEAAGAGELCVWLEEEMILGSPFPIAVR